MAHAHAGPEGATASHYGSAGLGPPTSSGPITPDSIRLVTVRSRGSAALRRSEYRAGTNDTRQMNAPVS